MKTFYINLMKEHIEKGIIEKTATLGRCCFPDPDSNCSLLKVLTRRLSLFLPTPPQNSKSLEISVNCFDLKVFETHKGPRDLPFNLCVSYKIFE